MDLIQLALKDPAQKPSSITSCAAPLSSETGYRDKQLWASFVISTH